jgi:hypothetical protein
MSRQRLPRLALPFLLLSALMLGEGALAARVKAPTQKTIQATPAVHYYHAPKHPVAHLTQAHRPHLAHG